MTSATKTVASLIVVGLLVAVVLTPRARSTLALARAGTAYVAKTMCTGVFVAGMDPERLSNEELAVGRGVVQAEIREEEGEVIAEALFGMVTARAKRQGNLGCSLYHEGDPPVSISMVVRPSRSDPKETSEPWPIAPFATAVPPVGIDTLALNTVLDDAFSEPDPSNPRRTRAVVIVQNGWVVAERYAPGIDQTTPMTGWSMTKSVTHAIIGIAVAEEILALDQPIPVPEWSAPDDPRRAITLDHLLRMSSGLAFSEIYDDFTSDVIVMLMLTRDAGAFAAAKPLEHEPGMEWEYSSGTTNLLMRGLRLAMNDDEAYWRFPYERLFEPLGMHSAILETDPSGTFVGSSFGYATARDWARFGLLYLNDGIWNGERILPEGWVDYGTTPTPDSEQGYGAHWWLNRGGRLAALPADEYQAQGFDGQRVMVIPSRKTVIVRLGQTPPMGFDFDAFGSAVLNALPTMGTEQ